MASIVTPLLLINLYQILKRAFGKQHIPQTLQPSSFLKFCLQ